MISKDRRKNLQSDVHLGDVLPEPVRAVLLLGEMLLSTVQSFEKSDHVLLVRLGSGRKARLVDAVVDEIVLPLVRLLNIILEFLGVKLNTTILLVDNIIELLTLASFVFHAETKE